MRQSGLADLLPSLQDTVWVGLSAGSMVTDGTVEVVSEGHWKLFPSLPRPTAIGVAKGPLRPPTGGDQCPRPSRQPENYPAF